MNFYVFTNAYKDKGYSVTKKVLSFLKEKGANIYVDKLSCDDFPVCDIPYVSFSDNVPDNIDFAVVIGGDGSILNAARRLYGKNIPIAGINMGKVGYLAELEVNECECLGVLFEKDYMNKVYVDNRMMLECSVTRSGNVVYSCVCLNEIVVAKGEVSRMIDIDLVMDDKTLVSYQCDGVIASTPTGSTAYSMSAGGPVIDPKVECLTVIPLCPYLSINKGPIIFSKDSDITLYYRSQRGNSAALNLDGGESYKLCDGDRIHIKRAEHTAKLLRFKPNDFCNIFNTKLSHRANELADR